MKGDQAALLFLCTKSDGTGIFYRSVAGKGRPLFHQKGRQGGKGSALSVALLSHFVTIDVKGKLSSGIDNIYECAIIQV